MQDEPTNTEVVEEAVADEPQLAEPNQESNQETEQAEAPEVVEETEEAEADEEQEEAPAPSRREQLRIQQLLQKYGDPTQRQQQAPSQRSDALDYGTALDADPEVIKQLEADRQAASQRSYNEGLKRAEFLDWKTSLKIDAPNIEKKYPILDPKNKEHFHPAVADALNRMYMSNSGFNPDTQTVNPNAPSYADFVESHMELVEEIAGQRTAQTAKNVAKQSAQTGLRPDGSSAKRLNLNQAPENMTIEELYAAMGQKPPKK